MSRIATSKKVLHWAIRRTGLSVSVLERKLPKLRQWISGEELPTLKQLETLAKATSTPLGFLFLEEPPEEEMPIPHFRTSNNESPDRPSPDLLDMVQMMQRRQSWMREFLVDEGEESLPFVGSENTKKSAPEVAEHIRRMLRFGSDWAAKQATWTHALHLLRDAMELAGIVVAINGIVGNNTQRKLNPSEFRGFVLVDEYAPLVFVNGADGKAAQMFTLAHELAHIFFGSSAAFDLREMRPANNPTEQSCNRVAAEFLVPEKDLRNSWSSVRKSHEPFQAIARRFKVSALVGARRALDLHLIGLDEFRSFYRSYLENERRLSARRSGGGDFYATQMSRVGRRFGDAVVRAAKEGKLLYSEAYRLTGLYGKTFERFADSLTSGAIND